LAKNFALRLIFMSTFFLIAALLAAQGLKPSQIAPPLGTEAGKLDLGHSGGIGGPPIATESSKPGLELGRSGNTSMSPIGTESANPNASVSKAPPGADAKPTKDSSEDLSLLRQLLGALGAVALGALGILAKVLKSQRDSLVKSLGRFFSPPEVAPDESFSSTLVLGIGGSGKTTLVNRITTDHTADPAKETDAFRISGITFDTPATRPEKRCKMFMADYVGQNLGTLIRGFVLEQRRESPLAYGFITSLILIVDLVDPPALAGDPTIPRPDISASRVEENLAAWNKQALSAVFGLLTNRLQFVCLFINKADAIRQPMAEVEAEARRLFRPLHEDLGRRSRGAKFLLIVGSADGGMGLSELRDELVASSISSKVLKDRST
jgi:hypothetical protein